METLTSPEASRQARELREQITAEKRTIRRARDEAKAKAQALEALEKQCARFGIELVMVPEPECMGRPSSPGETAAVARDVSAGL